MRTLLVALSLILTHTAIAQQLGRRGQRGYVPEARQIQATEPEKPDAEQVTQERAVFYAKELNVDAFTMEVVKTYMRNYYTKKFDIQYDPKLKFDEKFELINSATKVYEQELSGVLNEDQVEKILNLENTPNLSKAEKKKRKREERRKKKKGN